jgi:hypothetical protein
MNNECPLCGRELIPGPSIDEHHLLPKTFKGKETTTLHKICHRTIHATFTERELEQYYHTIERLLESEKIQKFVKWVKKKDPEFYEKTKDTKERKSKRGRR